jgi:hypothetical protein
MAATNQFHVVRTATDVLDSLPDVVITGSGLALDRLSVLSRRDGAAPTTEPRDDKSRRNWEKR